MKAGAKTLPNKLSRTYATLLEALNRHRGKGQQKVTVEHVHVHPGGQAVVGAVEPPGAGITESVSILAASAGSSAYLPAFGKQHIEAGCQERHDSFDHDEVPV